MLGLHTSSFRISLLIPESVVPEAVQRMHRRLIEAAPPTPAE